MSKRASLSKPLRTFILKFWIVFILKLMACMFELMAYMSSVEVCVVSGLMPFTQSSQASIESHRERKRINFIKISFSRSFYWCGLLFILDQIKVLLLMFFLVFSLIQHWKVVKHIFRYLKDIAHYCLHKIPNANPTFSL